MISATRIRLYPTAEQQHSLAVQFGCVRWVYNNALDLVQRTYRETGRGVGYYDLQNRLPTLKQEFPWLADADSQAIQCSLRNLASAFQNFFEKRAKYPRFKKKNGGQSVRYPQRVKLTGDRIYLPKVGWVKCVVHREIVGPIRTVTVSKTQCGHYYASIATDDGRAAPPISADGPAVGIDVGLIDFAVTSNGQRFANPRHLRKAEKNLKRKQQKLSRKQRGSKSRDKARRRVARVYERIANARKDFLHKVSRKLVDENQVLAVEDLSVKAMIKSLNLAKSISDAGWATFSRFVEYKAAWDGKLFVRTNRFSPSSKTCHVCGMIHGGMKLSVRRWTCTGCNTDHCRDQNAACNIRDEAKRMIWAGVIPAPAPGMGAAASGGAVSRRRGRKPSVTQAP